MTASARRAPSHSPPPSRPHSRSPNLRPRRSGSGLVGGARARPRPRPHAPRPRPRHRGRPRAAAVAAARALDGAVEAHPEFGTASAVRRRRPPRLRPAAHRALCAPGALPDARLHATNRGGPGAPRLQRERRSRSPRRPPPRRARRPLRRPRRPRARAAASPPRRSVRDDATRLWRGARNAARFDLDRTPTTRALLEAAVARAGSTRSPASASGPSSSAPPPSRTRARARAPRGVGRPRGSAPGLRLRPAFGARALAGVAAPRFRRAARRRPLAPLSGARRRSSSASPPPRAARAARETARAPRGHERPSRTRSRPLEGTCEVARRAARWLDPARQPEASARTPPLGAHPAAARPPPTSKRWACLRGPALGESLRPLARGALPRHAEDARGGPPRGARGPRAPRLPRQRRSSHDRRFPDVRPDCSICGLAEPDPRLLQDCFECGNPFHLNPVPTSGARLRRRLIGESLGVEYYCQTCIDRLRGTIDGRSSADPATARYAELTAGHDARRSPARRRPQQPLHAARDTSSLRSPSDRACGAATAASTCDRAALEGRRRGRPRRGRCGPGRRFEDDLDASRASSRRRFEDDLDEPAPLEARERRWPLGAMLAVVLGVVGGPGVLPAARRPRERRRAQPLPRHRRDRRRHLPTLGAPPVRRRRAHAAPARRSPREPRTPDPDRARTR